MFATLPTSSVSDITTNINGIISDFMPLILLVLGVMLGLFIISRVLVNIGSFDNKNKEEIN
jgi:hypothetical protein